MKLVGVDLFDKYYSNIEAIHAYESQEIYKDGAIDMFNEIMNPL